jgi:serine/threonine protein kinase/formylglycine-generating enzyme required for sulfatase activity
MTAASGRYDAILDTRLKPESFTRRALRVLESDFRQFALAALVDWERLELVVPELFPALASLQRPSWGSWNGLVAGLRGARRIVLQSRPTEERDKVTQATVLTWALTLFDQPADAAIAESVLGLARTLGRAPVRRVKWEHVLVMPITLRNAIEHGKSPESDMDPDWWVEVASRLRSILSAHRGGRFVPPLDEGLSRAAPWFRWDGGQVWSFNGLTDSLEVVYVSADGRVQHDRAAGQAVLLSVQRMLGKADLHENDFRRLLARLAPEEHRGVLLGDYLLGPPVGTGGFASVHVGRQLSTGRKVALKVLRDGMTEDEVRRFREEALHLSRLRHPHIVEVLDQREDTWTLPRQVSWSEEPWIQELKRSAPVKTFTVMEWIDGETLEDVFQRPGEQQPSTETIVEWFAQAANALKAVHAAGLVHRDVKPQNLMITSEGQLKLVDFGIARNQGELKSLMTLVGQQLGTPAYMAPEQLSRSETDTMVGPAADIYGLCASFYELFTGTRLYQHDLTGEVAVQQKKLSGQPPDRPRRYRREIPWEIETLLLGGLNREITDRPKSTDDLEDDLRRVQRNEPIWYRRPSPLRRVQLCFRRNRTVASLTAVFLLLAALGTASYIASIKAVIHQRALAQVEALLKARPEAVPSILDVLTASRTDVLPRLRELRVRSDLPALQRRRVELALRLIEGSEFSDLLEEMLAEEDPEEMVLLRDVLVPRAPSLHPDLWPVASTAADPERRFRALVVLSVFDPGNEAWERGGMHLAEELVGANPLHLGTWSEAVSKVKDHLIAPLATIYREDTSPERRQRAADLLLSYAGDDLHFLAQLYLDGDDDQSARLRPRLAARQHDLAALFESELSKPSVPPPGARNHRDQHPSANATAKRQAHAAAALLRMGRAAPVWPLFAQQQEPRVRSYLVHCLAQRDVAAADLVRRFVEESDPSARRALALALGAYPKDAPTGVSPEELERMLLEVYRNDPDSGLHSAIDWLLRKWNGGNRLNAVQEIDRELATGEVVGDRRWYVSRSGKTLAVFPAGATFPMGTPSQIEPRGPHEVYHPRRMIGRSFALAVHEVTVGEFARFCEAYPAHAVRREKPEFAPEPDCPMHKITWFAAAKFCRWLSELEGVPEAQMCYPPIDEIGPDLELPEDYLARTGYRLPTEDEWEYACRAGTVTPRYYGDDIALLGQYAWYAENSSDRTHCVGLLKPNDFGLFDMLGNVWEWCDNRFVEFPLDDSNQTIDPHDRGMRGGSFSQRSSDLRSATRFRIEPQGDRNSVGLRVARTLPAPGSRALPSDATASRR